MPCSRERVSFLQDLSPEDSVTATVSSTILDRPPPNTPQLLLLLPYIITFRRTTALNRKITLFLRSQRLTPKTESNTPSSFCNSELGSVSCNSDTTPMGYPATQNLLPIRFRHATASDPLHHQSQSLLFYRLVRF